MKKKRNPREETFLSDWYRHIVKPSRKKEETFLSDWYRHIVKPSRKKEETFLSDWYRHIVKPSRKKEEMFLSDWYRRIGKKPSKKCQFELIEIRQLPEKPRPTEQQPITKPPKKLKIYAYRDNLGGQRHNYKGVTLYFIGKSERADDIQYHFQNVLEGDTGMLYEPSALSVADIDQIRTDTEPLQPGDFIFEIGDLKSGKFQYWGVFHNGTWANLNIYDEFDIDTLTDMLTGDQDENE